MSLHSAASMLGLGNTGRSATTFQRATGDDRSRNMKKKEKKMIKMM